MKQTEPTLLSAAWRYRILVLVITGIVVALGTIFLLLQPDDGNYRATTSVVLQEPISAEGLTSAEVASGRFVASQVQIIDSPVVAAQAATILAEIGFETTAAEISSSISVVSTVDSPLVTITATQPTPDAAVAVANAVAEGYRQAGRRQATATAQSQLTQLTAQLEGIEDRLGEIDAELRDSRAEAPGLDAIEAQAREAVERIAQLQAEVIEAPEDEAVAIRQRINDYRERIAVYEQVATAIPGGPRQAALVEEQALLVDRRAELQRLRDETAVEAELAPDAVALVEPAEAAFLDEGVGAVRTLGVATVLGMAAGIALAYFLSVSRRSFQERRDPQAILESPLLADIPNFTEEGLKTSLPVRDAPRSAAAEAFRFAASSLAHSVRARRISSVAMISATQGQGKTTTLVNTAMAAAVHGLSVLVVDCDFGNQEATRLLIGDERARPGITDILDGVTSPTDAIGRILFGDGIHLDVISRGTRPTAAAASLQSEAAGDFFAGIVGKYDVIFVDTPPYLQVAYASRLTEMVQGVVVVIEHESQFRQAEELASRLSLVGTPIIGYIYNRSPLRREMTMSEGSMMDVIGDSGLSADSEVRRPRRRA